MTRQQLVHLVNELEEEQLDIAASCLMYLRDSNNPDDSWETPEFQAFLRRRIEESLEEEDRGEFVTQQEARAQFRQIEQRPLR